MVPPKIHHVWCWTWLARPVLQGFAGRVPGPKAKGEDFRPHPENVGYSYTKFHLNPPFLGEHYFLNVVTYGAITVAIFRVLCMGGYLHR